MEHERADTYFCVRENMDCDYCKNKPVAFSHWGDLTDQKLKHLCVDCFNDLKHKN